ncbi:MAG: hypothetical protein KGR26_07490, partial [Cyanobacteria bacterium REEB65]|nr:hypothetical protein [Cyanobacteria bacterium REEB65]
MTTTVTDPSGNFSLHFSNWTPTANYPYLLEAVKGLSVGGSPNRVGANAARLRTLVLESGGVWTSITGHTIQLSRSTTALCVIASLRGLTVAQQQALIGTVTIGSPDTFSGTAQIATSEYSAVWGLADSCITLDEDPVGSIGRDVNNGTYFGLGRGPVVTDLSAANG